MSRVFNMSPVFTRHLPAPPHGPRFGHDYLCHPSLALSGESYSCFNDLWFVRQST